MQTQDLTSRARHRLVSVSGPDTDTGTGTDADTGQQTDPPRGAVAPPVPAREDTVSRWVPQRWRGARADPGRRGAVALAAVAACAAVIAAVGVWRERPVERVPPLPPALVATDTASGPSSSAATPTEVQPPALLVVSVAGAVTEPGLVTLPSGSRVADALAAAGGALPGTDLLTLNLAQPLGDGEQVLVGVPGPPVSGATAGPSGSAGTPPTGADAAIDLNTATDGELQELPGVGPVMAQAIIDYRTEHGSFASVEQLMDVSGIGDSRFARLKDLVRV